MKYIILLVSLYLMISCANSHDNTFVLSATIEHTMEQEQVYLSYPVLRDGVWYERIDTATIIGGKFQFEGPVAGTIPAFLNFDNMDGEYLYLEPANLRLRMDRKRPYTYTLSGLSVDKEVAELQNALAQSQKIRYGSHRRVQDLNAQWLAAEEKEKDQLWTLFYNAVQSCKSDFFREDSRRFNFALEHMDYSIAPDLLYISSRRQTADNLIIRQAYDRLPEASRNSIVGELAGIQIGFHAGDFGSAVGDRAFDFVRTDASGNTTRLSDYKGGYVLLDFWASWCGPCIRETPNVKKINLEFGKRGLQVVGISCDEDRASWLGAIEQHGLTAYPQVLAVELGDNNDRLLFENQQNLFDLYGIQSIPQFVLIGKDGKIIARWQHIGEDQFTYLDQML